jgi:Family of unknown function (DUF6800)
MEKRMSAPSRRPEIRRRRTRHEKVQKLKKTYARSASDADKTRVAAKLERMALKSPGQPLITTA